MKIALLEPYSTGSHRQWIAGLIEHSSHDFCVFELPGVFWKWRMHAGAIELSESFLDSKFEPDIVLATDMLDVSTFQALTRHTTATVPYLTYFHENQITYPWSQDDRDVQQGRDRHYGFINFVSALVSDGVVFNSAFHKESFLGELHPFLKSFPQSPLTDQVKNIRDKSHVLPVGLDWDRLRGAKERGRERRVSLGERPVVVWNHRWEYDKNPVEFFSALTQVSESGLDFGLVVLGESFQETPSEFREASQKLAPHIVHWGYCESYDDYASWLWASDYLPVTSRQEFFGVSCLEAIACECIPLLPKRLTYPEIIPFQDHQEYFYEDAYDLVRMLERELQARSLVSIAQVAQRFDWKSCVQQYDLLLNHIGALR